MTHMDVGNADNEGSIICPYRRPESFSVSVLMLLFSGSAVIEYLLFSKDKIMFLKKFIMYLNVESIELYLINRRIK